jgi:hypothetical protein
VLPQPKGAMRLRGQHPRRAARPKGASPGGSSVAMAPWSGSRRPSTRSRRGQRSTAELHHLGHNASNRRGDRRNRDGLLRGSRLLHHHRRHGVRQHHHHHPSPGHRPLHRRQKHRWPGTPAKGPGSPQQGRRSPLPPGADGSGTTSRK